MERAQLTAAFVGLLVVSTLARSQAGDVAIERARPLALAREPHPQQRIVNGLTTVAFPSTVALLDGGSATGDGEPFCTGTLIGCQTVLTAAHCVCDSNPGGVDGALCQSGGANLTSASAVRVFAQSGGVFAVSSIEVPSTFEFLVGSDVALVHLASTVSGIAPAPINSTGTPADGSAGLIAGFGRTSGLVEDYGVKRWGSVVVAPCTGAPEANHICWSFENPVGPPGADSNTCHGDSGGPLFANPGAGVVVAGVTSGGNTLCLPPDNAFDADVFVERTWIQTEGGPDITNTTCGALTQVGSPDVGLFFAEGVLDLVNTDDLWFVEVPPGTEHLRVTLNGINGSDFDLYVRYGSPPTDATFDCRPFRDGHIEACDFPVPTAGTWYVRVKRFSGAAALYQTTLTIFGPSSFIFSNGFESGDTSAWSTTSP